MKFAQTITRPRKFAILLHRWFHSATRDRLSSKTSGAVNRDSSSPVFLLARENGGQGPRYPRMIFRLALVAFATALLSGSAWSDDGTAAAAETDAKFLFALRGEARLDGDRLVVQTAHVDWFTDRPVRRAGRMTGEAFAGQWEEMGFDSVPPNAFLAGDVSDVVVVLTEPAATATELAFTVSKVVAGDTASGDLGSIGMFIDSADGDIGFGNTGNTNIGDP